MRILFFSTLFCVGLFSTYSFHKVLANTAPCSSSVKANINQQTTVVFDLGEVVMFTDTGKAVKSLGAKELFNFLPMAFKMNGLTTKQKFFKCLNQLYGKDANSCYPLCFRNLFTGKVNGDQLYSDICKRLENSNLSKTEKKFVRSCAKNLQTEQMVDVQYLDKKAAKFICELANSVDTNGQPIKIMILSNWDKDSFALLRQKYKNLFDTIGDKNIIISGNIGLMKPDINIFEYMLQTHNLNPANCYFIDDMFENVYAARECGIKSVLHQDWKKTQKHLKDFGLRYKTKKSKSDINCLAAMCA